MNFCGKLNIRKFYFIVTLSSLSISINASAEVEVPPGFHLMPDGKIMANNPSSAEAPPGYHLRPNGILLRIDFDDDEDVAPAPELKPGEVPPGFHKMPDGRIMANDPENAVAPPGYHIMGEGVLMANSGGGDHSAHHGHHGHGGHHGAGMWMFDYRYIRMNMDGLLDTTKKVSAEAAVDMEGEYGYMMSPVDMTMDMHMLMGMYGLTDKSMIMVMLHYMENDMSMLSTDGTRSSMSTSGIADSVVSFMLQGPHKLTFNVGLGLPTGSINESGPMTHTADFTEQGVRYPYGMQLGSGSYELKQGISYTDAADKLSWGGSYEYTARLNDNDNDYRLGDVLLMDVWFGWNFFDTLSSKLKFDFRSQSQIKGFDEKINQNKNMSPAADSTSSGGTRIDTGFEIKWQLPDPMINVNMDFVLPVYQNLWGPQMATTWILGLGVGIMF